MARVLTSAEIRETFFDFFRSKEHTLVPSASLLPDAPNLLFTNAGMNQFVPYFLGQQKCPYRPPRVANTQKCIRAGGKHNDLEDVGLDTYHHTYFEMLGNWSFGDYYKKEAIEWAWELLTEVWGFPRQRLYASVYEPDPEKGDPAEFDQEAYEHWRRVFAEAGLEPGEHIVTADKADNFWMMGDTGPCGPNSEIHVDLSPSGDQGAALVNRGSAACIELWNLVFIQYNANPDGSFTPLSRQHVDTGMGFERVAAILQCTKGFTDFHATISNYETDLFHPIFRKVEELSGETYGATLPDPAVHIQAQAPEVRRDVAFRVVADHVRALSFSIADGILPGNEGRGYVLRRILRRAVRYGRSLGFHEPFFFKLAGVLVEPMGDAFPELRERRQAIEATLRGEEEHFNRTLDRGIDLLSEAMQKLKPGDLLDAETAFTLYDTYGFPLDLTELMARERGFRVDVSGFERLMEGQRRRAREDYERKKATVLSIDDQADVEPTRFLGYENLEAEAVVEAVVEGEGPSQFEIVFDQTPFYAEMGGQVGDAGLVHVPGHDWTEVGTLQVVDTQRQGEVYVHRSELKQGRAPELGEGVRIAVDAERRANIQRHHTATHLFHWALHEVVSRDARQRGSLVAPDRLRFDFNHPEKLSEQQVADIERLVHERIREDAPVYWFEVPYDEVKDDPRVMQFFGEKYGEVVRVVQMGGRPGQMDGFSIELCGGTHTRRTGELETFRIARESSISAGVRRVEAMTGPFARAFAEEEAARRREEAERMESHAREKERAKRKKRELEEAASARASDLLERVKEIDGVRLIAETAGELEPDGLRSMMDVVRGRLGSGVIVLGSTSNGKGHFVASVSPDLVQRGVHAGKLISQIAKIANGGGGGQADKAQAGCKQPEKLPEAIRQASSILRQML